jgi:hypothetical protein
MKLNTVERIHVHHSNALLKSVKNITTSNNK